MSRQLIPRWVKDTMIQFPVITTFKGVTRSQVDNVASALGAMLRQGGMSQMALAVGLCNTLSYCFQLMILKVETQQHRDAMLILQDHLQHIVNVLDHLRRHPEDIPRNSGLNETR